MIKALAVYWKELAVLAALLLGILMYGNLSLEKSKLELEFSVYKNGVLQSEADRKQDKHDFELAVNTAAAEIYENAIKENKQLAADKRSLSGQLGGLRGDLAAVTAANRALRNAAAALGGTAANPGADPLDLLAELLYRAEERGAGYSGFADEAVKRGQRCERLYDVAQRLSVGS